jgi:hypothetical protein
MKKINSKKVMSIIGVMSVSSSSSEYSGRRIDRAEPWTLRFASGLVPAAAGGAPWGVAGGVAGGVAHLDCRGALGRRAGPGESARPDGGELGRGSVDRVVAGARGRASAEDSGGIEPSSARTASTGSHWVEPSI